MRLNVAAMCNKEFKMENTCLVCNRRLRAGASCEDHGDNGRQYECLFCDTNFSRQASLVWHLRTVHNYKLAPKGRSSSSGSEHNYHERPTCLKCSVEVQNAYELEKHVCAGSKTVTAKPHKPVGSLISAKKTVASSASSSCSAKKPVKSSQSPPNSSKKPVEPPITYCTICKTDFPSEDAYHEHFSKYVTRYRPFFCCICQSTFSRKRSLVFHLYIHKRSSEPESKVSRLSDIDVPPRGYPYVPLSKTKPKASVKHKSAKKEVKLTPEKVENKEPPRKSARVSAETKKLVPKYKPQIIDIRNTAKSNQKCATCRKKFNTVLKLETHMMSYHSAPLVHKCSLCTKAFVLKASLLNHAASHIF